MIEIKSNVFTFLNLDGSEYKLHLELLCGKHLCFKNI